MFVRLKTFYDNRKLKGKISIVFLSGLFIYLLFFILFFLHFYRISVQKENIQEKERVIEELSENINTQISLINKVSISILGNNIIRSFIKEETKTAAMEQQVLDELYQNAFISDYIESIYLIDHKGKSCFINYSSIDATRKNDFDKGWCKSLAEKNGKSVILLNADHAYYNNSYDVLSLMRAIYDIDSQKLIGYLVINMSVDILQDPFQKFWGESDIYIMGNDAKGNVIAEKGDAGVLACPDVQRHNKPSFMINKGLQSFLFIENVLDDSGLSLIYASQVGFWQNLQLNLMICALIFVVITIIFILLLNRTITLIVTDPVAKLVGSMKRIEEGHFYRVSMKTHNDEIGILKDTYNIMLVKINQLIEKLLDEERAKKRLELDVLHEQIKPHFLYNTLSTIEYLALTGKRDETVACIETLERFYKNSLSNGLQNVTVEQEVMIARDYLTIQKMRFGDLFNAEFVVDEELKGNFVPKLILQPLVENCLTHGIYPKGEHGTIRVEVRKEQEDMMIQIYDDGVGMDEGILKQMLEGKQESKSFGLKGTLMRIQYYYGIEKFYKISSEPGYYTRILLRLPIKRKEYHEKDKSNADR